MDDLSIEEELGCVFVELDGIRCRILDRAGKEWVEILAIGDCSEKELLEHIDTQIAAIRELVSPHERPSPEMTENLVQASVRRACEIAAEHRHLTPEEVFAEALIYGKASLESGMKYMTECKAECDRLSRLDHETI